MRILIHFETLLYYDGPELITAHDQLGTRFLCLLIDVSDEDDTYVCIPISPGRLKNLMVGQIDLRSVFVNPETAEYFQGVVANGDLERIEAIPISLDALGNAWLPEAELFLEAMQPVDNQVIQESQERQRAVIHCTLNPPEANTESKISAEHLSQAIRLFQRVIRHAYGKALKGMQGNIKSMVSSSENFELEVFAFSPGSFTVHMQAAVPADLVGYSYVARAIDILDSVNFEIDDPVQATKVLAQYGGHFVTAYKDLLQFILETETPIAYEWSMPSKPESTRTRIIPRQVKPLLEALRERVELGEEEVRLVGRFTKVDEKLGTWRLFVSDDKKEYSGESDIQLAGLVIETKIYELSCVEKLEEERGSGKEMRRLILRSYKES